jgi:pimeloyl-ACP methyl ester carboxylesterase
MRDIIASQKNSVPGLVRSVFIEKCGHWAPQEQPRVVSETILEFLGKLEDGH